MAETTEPKKETVRIAVRPPASNKPGGERETVRITLPSRAPSTAQLQPPTREPAVSPIQPPKFIPPPASATSRPPAAPMSPSPIDSPLPGPKKETARISILPDPPATPASAPSVQMKKTQPLIDLPARSVPALVNPVTVREQPVSRVSELPMAFCWGLVAVSAVVLLIQILNYIS